MNHATESDGSLPHLPPRKVDAHKGDFGRALIVGGSQGMAGAVGLSATAALRGGAGLVRAAVPLVCQATVASFEPSYMTVGLPCDAAGRLTAAAIDEVIQLAETATAVALGPGLGRSEELTQLVDQLYRQIACPMVVDADALNALSEQPAALDGAGGPRVLTPHPGEFKRLSNGRYGSAGELAARTGAVVVLKGHQTEVADGRRTFHNTTGNPGMATGGSGDVLTGLITALICQGLSAWEAARLGVHIHGLAGDLAAAELGEVGMIASDLVRFLPAALKGL